MKKILAALCAFVASAALAGPFAIVGGSGGSSDLTGPISSTSGVTTVTSKTGSGSTFVMQSSPTINTPTFVAPALGTPTSGVATNLTGTASGLTSGTATIAIDTATKTGSGSTYVTNSSPTINTPTISGTLTASSGGGTNGINFGGSTNSDYGLRGGTVGGITSAHVMLADGSTTAPLRASRYWASNGFYTNENGSGARLHFGFRGNGMSITDSSNSAYYDLEVRVVLTGPVAVSGLPTCNSTMKGSRAFVTDANATTFNSTVAGGGTDNMPVFCNGTDWKIG